MNVGVSNRFGTSDFNSLFTYETPPPSPTVPSVAPDTGPTGGGTMLISNQENPNAPWKSDFQMIQHLEESATGAMDFKDSTSNNFHSTFMSISGAGSNPDATGIIGGAVEFDGNQDRIKVSNVMSFGKSTPFTYSAG